MEYWPILLIFVPLLAYFYNRIKKRNIILQSNAKIRDAAYILNLRDTEEKNNDFVKLKGRIGSQAVSLSFSMEKNISLEIIINPGTEKRYNLSIEILQLQIPNSNDAKKRATIEDDFDSDILIQPSDEKTKTALLAGFVRDIINNAINVCDSFSIDAKRILFKTSCSDVFKNHYMVAGIVKSLIKVGERLLFDGDVKKLLIENCFKETERHIRIQNIKALGEYRALARKE